MHNIDDYFLLSELITTKICHDLAGSSGAIANGVEFLSGDDDFVQEAKDLIAMSSNTINAKIKLFRLAFGLIDKKNSDFEVLKKTIADYVLENNNVKINWTISNSLSNQDDKIKMVIGKLIMLLSMPAVEAVQTGGSINVSVFTGKELLKISLEAERLILSQEVLKIIDMLKNKPELKTLLENTTPRTIPITYAFAVAKEETLSLKITNSQNMLDLIIEKV